MSNSLWPHGLQPVRLLCPWKSPGQNTWVGSHSHLQGFSQPRDWTQVSTLHWASQVVLVVKNPPDNAGDIRDPGSIPGLGRSPGEVHGNPQYSCLENPVDRGAWQATVHRVTQSWTWLKWQSTLKPTVVTYCSEKKKKGSFQNNTSYLQCTWPHKSSDRDVWVWCYFHAY